MDCGQCESILGFDLTSDFLAVGQCVGNRGIDLCQRDLIVFVNNSLRFTTFQEPPINRTHRDSCARKACAPTARAGSFGNQLADFHASTLPSAPTYLKPICSSVKIL